MTLRAVERLNGHRYERKEVYCSRCGVHVAEAEEKSCVPSTVEVLPARTDSGRDPDEVLPSLPRAGRQAELNGPSGSPTSRPERDDIPFAPTKPYRNLWDVQQP